MEVSRLDCHRPRGTLYIGPLWAPGEIRPREGTAVVVEEGLFICASGENHTSSEQKWPARNNAGCGSSSGIGCGVMEAEGRQIRSDFFLGRVIGISLGGRCADEEMIHSSIVTVGNGPKMAHFVLIGSISGYILSQILLVTNFAFQSFTFSSTAAEANRLPPSAVAKAGYIGGLVASTSVACPHLPATGVRPIRRTAYYDTRERDFIF